MGLENDSEIIQHPDGRVELRDRSSIESSPLYNEDLAPVPVAKRNWTTYNYAWISMAHCIPTYMLASGLIAAGMNWRQALFTTAWQHHRAQPDPAQFAPRHEIWNSLPGLRAGQLRRDRIEPAGVDASACGLRLVRHSGMDRRRGAAHAFQSDHTGVADARGRACGRTLRPNGCRFCSSGG